MRRPTQVVGSCSTSRRASRDRLLALLGRPRRPQPRARPAGLRAAARLLDPERHRRLRPPAAARSPVRRSTGPQSATASSSTGSPRVGRRTTRALGASICTSRAASRSTRSIRTTSNGIGFRSFRFSSSSRLAASGVSFYEFAFAGPGTPVPAEAKSRLVEQLGRYELLASR